MVLQSENCTKNCTSLCESLRHQAKSKQNDRQDLIPRVLHGGCSHGTALLVCRLYLVYCVTVCPKFSPVRMFCCILCSIMYILLRGGNFDPYILHTKPCDDAVRKVVRGGGVLSKPVLLT